MKNTHLYTLQLNWTGEASKDSHQNDRLFQVDIAGKESFMGSADKPFFGDPSKYNPEDLLMAALSSCHMMSFLYLCRKHEIQVERYTDNPEGRLQLYPDGSGKFVEVRLRPIVKLRDAGQNTEAHALHSKAGKLCFIANSCNFPILYEPSFK